MTNTVNQLALSPKARSEMMVHTLSRRTDDEVRDALAIILAIRERTQGKHAWPPDEGGLWQMVVKFGDRTPANAKNTVIRVLYVEYADAPVLGTRLSQMLIEVAKWEGKIWRLAGHVRLGLDRCAERLRNEMERRARNRALTAAKAQARRRKSRDKE